MYPDVQDIIAGFARARNPGESARREDRPDSALSAEQDAKEPQSRTPKVAKEGKILKTWAMAFRFAA